MTGQDLQKIKAANLLPLNQAAQSFLDQTSWRGPSTMEIAAIALMRWGMEEAGMQASEMPGRSTQEQLESQVNRLSEMDPKAATEWLERAAESDDPDEVTLTAQDLQEQETPEEAAYLLLEKTFDKMEVLM
ncbi:MAG: hypothetical protein OEV28_12825 [Nitrospirota bacterium]|nr:hypothetical protein [Nitrospirota bacterium]